MRIATRIASCATAVFVVGLALAGVWAEEEPGKKPSMPPPQKPISHPFVSAVLGSWKTTITGGVVGSGTATFALGVADTCLLHDERGEHGEPGGHSMKTAGHGIYKVSDDGKTATAWWIDNHTPEPLRVSGPITETGYDLSGDTPQGKVRVVLQKTATGLAFRMYMGGSPEPAYTQTYERAPAVR